MSVDVASGETLQKLAIFDVKDVQQLSPGLELTNNALGTVGGRHAGHSDCWLGRC